MTIRAERSTAVLHSALMTVAITFGLYTIPAEAATYSVTKTADTNDGVCDADCSLREAISVAAVTAADDVIVFAPGVTGTITLVASLQVAAVGNNGTLSINGPTTEPGITVSGDDANGVFIIVGLTTTAELNHLTISGGSSPRGGGIENQAALTVNNSTITANRASQAGAGIWSGNNGTLTINNSTISGNVVASDGTAGGGIFGFSGNVTLNNSTVINNTAPIGGAGVMTTQASLQLSNTIIADNTGVSDCSSQDPSATFSLVESGDCIVDGVDGNIVADPMLGPLQNNGGSTDTHLPLAGSPAIDIGGTCGPADQRGFTAPVDGDGVGGIACDAGATESAAPPICGNGIIETGEQCDDGNTVDGDSCSSACIVTSIPVLLERFDID